MPPPGSCRSTALTETSRTPPDAKRSSGRRSCSAASAPGRYTPAQIEIAKRVFSDREEVRFAKKVIEAIPDGRGVHMIDGKMQDDATWKQCKVIVDLAEQDWPGRTPSWPRPTGWNPSVPRSGSPPPHALLRVRIARHRARRRYR